MNTNRMSTLALCELLLAVVDELDHRGRADSGIEGIVNGWDTITTAWGDLRHDVDGWSFVWDSEGSAELALRDRGHGCTPQPV
jgi:hypothetical protein